MEREALHKAAIKFSLDLHPSATGDVMEGVRDQLNAVLLRCKFMCTLQFMHRNIEVNLWLLNLNTVCCCRYSTYLEGVLVSYTQPRIVSQQV